MIVTLGLALLLFTCVGVASVAVKAYSSLPPTLTNILLHLIDFFGSFIQTCFRLIYIVLLFVYSVTTYFMGTALNVVPTVYKVLTTLLGFFLWLTVHFIRGLLGLEDKAVNTISWLIATCVVFLYIDKNYQRLGGGGVFSGQINAEVLNDTDNNEENGTAEEINPNGHEDQQLETENRENENEENALEEADRNRANNDNVQNVQRELNRERVQLPVTHVTRVVGEESSDEELDPTICSICYIRRRSAALFPCGHTQLCKECARIITDTQRPCPICQTAVQEFRRVYV